VRRIILIAASLAEAGFGLLLLAYPPLVGQLLFGVDIFGMEVIFSRLTGACLIALAVACWPIGDVRGGLYGILTWSVLAMLYLLRVGIRGAPVGPILWPALVVHGVIAVLLVWSLRSQKT
jgi:hypothetical protein